MIFITVGSQKFQFDRLLKEVDSLVEKGYIEEEVFAQIGYSGYKPKNYQYKEFIDMEEFNDIMQKCDIVITHGGTGAIIKAIKDNKKVIAIPRLAKYGEHVDDHQLQIVNQFDNSDLICACYDTDNLYSCYAKINDMKFKHYVSNTELIIKSIENFLEGEK